MRSAQGFTFVLLNKGDSPENSGRKDTSALALEALRHWQVAHDPYGRWEAAAARMSRQWVARRSFAIVPILPTGPVG